MKSDSDTNQPSSKLHPLRNAIGKPVVLRTTVHRFARDSIVTECEGVLIEVHTEDGTVTVQNAAGDLRRVSKWEWVTSSAEGTFWHWPDAPYPEDPKDFKPTHFPKPPKSPGPKAA